MREVTIKGPQKQIVVLMCEKHFRSYKSKLIHAMEGGTSFSQKRTSKRGCKYCEVENGKS